MFRHNHRCLSCWEPSLWAAGPDTNLSQPWKAADEQPPPTQVLFENLPVALAAVDCEGTEASITDCQSNDRLIGLCTNITSSTVLACANSADGMSPAVSKHVNCPRVHDIMLPPDQLHREKLLVTSGRCDVVDGRQSSLHHDPRSSLMRLSMVVASCT